MARGPGVKAGSVSHVPVAGYDFLSTFYDLAGGKGTLTDEIDCTSFKSLLLDPCQTELKRPNDALIFHRPRRLESAIRVAEHKLLIKWNVKGDVVSRSLYRVDINPTEEGNDIAGDHSELVLSLEKQLLGYLDSVDAEKPKPQPPKKKRNKKGKKN